MGEIPIVLKLTVLFFQSIPYEFEGKLTEAEEVLPQLYLSLKSHSFYSRQFCSNQIRTTEAESIGRAYEVT